MRVEARSVLRARWFTGSIVLSVALVGFFAAVASRESALVGFTGYGRVMAGVVQVGLVFVPLLSLFATALAAPSARERGVLEFYLSQPISRADCFWGMFLPRLVAVAVPPAAAVPALGVLAAAVGDPVDPGLLVRFLALLLGQGFCFSAIGMLLGARARSTDRALLSALGVWVAAAALVDFAVLAVMLRWEVSPWVVFALAGVNPVQAGRLGMLVHLDAELGALGPVGTWLATTLGPAATSVYGLAWPVVVGAGCLALAFVGFGRRDAS